MKKLEVFLFASLLLLWGGHSLAEHPKVMDLPPDLDLSAEQVQKVEKVRLKAQRKAIKLRADLKLARLDLRELLQSDHPNKTAIYKKLDQIGALRTKLEKTHIDARLEICNLLTPEQRAKLQEIERGLQKRHHRLEGRRLPPPPPCWPPPLPPQPPELR